MAIEFVSTPRPTEHQGVLCHITLDGQPRLCHFTDQALACACGSSKSPPLVQFHAQQEALMEIAVQKMHAEKDISRIVHVYASDVRVPVAGEVKAPLDVAHTVTAPVPPDAMRHLH